MEGLVTELDRSFWIGLFPVGGEEELNEKLQKLPNDKYDTFTLVNAPSLD